MQLVPCAIDLCRYGGYNGGALAGTGSGEAPGHRRSRPHRRPAAVVAAAAHCAAEAQSGRWFVCVSSVEQVWAACPGRLAMHATLVLLRPPSMLQVSRQAATFSSKAPCHAARASAPAAGTMATQVQCSTHIGHLQGCRALPCMFVLLTNQC
jgi:hypothetical protein